MPMTMPPGKRLAVPPMHPDLNPHTRAQVLDYIERRMFVEAVNLAEDAEADRRALEFRGRHLGRRLAAEVGEYVPTMAPVLDYIQGAA